MRSLFIFHLAFGFSSACLAADPPDAERQRMLADFERLGGEYEREIVSASLRGRKSFTGDELVKLVFLKDHLRSLDLTHSSVTDEGLHKIHYFPELTNLSLAGTTITDDSLTRLAPLTRLRRLHLSKTAITGARFYDLSKLTELTYLDLSETKISQEGLRQLRALPSISRLYLSGTDTNNQGVAELAMLPNLEHLGLGGTNVQGDAGLEEAMRVKGTQPLQHLCSLSVDNTRVDDRLIGALSRLPALDTLTICDSHVTSAGVAKLGELRSHGFLKNLGHLYVSPGQLAAGTKEALEDMFPNIKVRIVESP